MYNNVLMNLTTASSLCWDIYPLICKWEWKLIPKFMRTCRTLYNRLKPLLYTISTTLEPTVYEQVRYVKEILIREWMRLPVDNDRLVYHLYKLNCNPIHLAVQNIRDSWKLLFLDSTDGYEQCDDVNRRGCFETVNEEGRDVFSDSCVTTIKRYLEAGYRLELSSRINCLRWRPNTRLQNVSMITSIFHRELQMLTGYDIDEYRNKHPFLDAKTNKNVHLYLDPSYEADNDLIPDAYISVFLMMAVLRSYTYNIYKMHRNTNS